MYELEQAEKYANAEVVVSPVVRTGFFWVILRMRPASPKSTVSGISWDHYHHRETIAIKTAIPGMQCPGEHQVTKPWRRFACNKQRPQGKVQK